MEDKRVALLYGILICAVFALGIGVLSLTLGNNDKEEENTKTTLRVSTKTRRTTTSTESTTTISTESTTSSSIPTTSNATSIIGKPTTVSSSTKKITTKNTTKASTKKTTKKTTAKTTKKTTTQVVIPPNPDRETTEESTTYPLAQDDIEWAIFDKINEERAKAGFNPVKMSVEFRRLAEEGADYLYDFGDEEVRQYLYGFNNYRRFSNNLLSVDKAVLSLYTATIVNTPVITDSSIRYVGIGVIFREIGLGDRPTYYYVIIYE